MKKAFTALTALLLGAALTAPAFAAEPLLISPAPRIAAAPQTSDENVENVEEKEVYPIIDGFEYAVVKSATSNASGSIGYFFDGTTKTMCAIDLSAFTRRVVSIYMTSSAPFTLSALAGAFVSDDPDVAIQLSVYGTNDSRLKDWTKIALSDEIEQMGDYTVFRNADYAAGKKAPESPATYQFYRLDLNLTSGTSFALSELVFFRPEGNLLLPVYDYSEGIELDAEPVGYVELIRPEPEKAFAEDSPEETADASVAFPFRRKLTPAPTPYTVAQ